MTQSDPQNKFNRQERYPSMTPIKGPPPLYRWNGCGVGLYGKRDFDAQTGAYIATWCISILFFPVLALKAFRVARAQRGWYFLGRERLSPLARWWNTVLIVTVLVTIGVYQFNIYTSSPAYRAKRQMDNARALAAAGRLGEAAGIYGKLAVAGGEQSQNAGNAIKDLLENQATTAPLSEAAGVYVAAAELASRTGVLTHGQVVDGGMKLAADRGDSDPSDAIAILNALRPLATDTRPIDDRQLALLRRWHAADPANLDAITGLASVLNAQGQNDEAKGLLLPVKDRLGHGEGARVLGVILGREGDYDGAYALLWPYVEERLDSLHAAEAAARAAYKTLWDHQIAQLKDNKAPRSFYDRYKEVGSDEQNAMVQRYVDDHIRDDPLYTRTQGNLEQAAHVVPVALDLGIVMLQRAQGQASPDERTKELGAAKQVFLAISGIAGQSDAYRLSLGQVYYWLGQQSDGRALFDEYLTAKGRNFGSMIEISGKLREVGSDNESRAMAEEAYNKTDKTEEKYSAAAFRSSCFKDLDDQIEWLLKSNPSEPSIKGDLAKAQGEKAFREGRDDEAARQYQNAIDDFASMPRNPESLNESALAYYALFQATGDTQAMQRCEDNFQQAVDLSPSDTILLGNAGFFILQGALADVIGDKIDLRALHESGSTALLGYLYSDQADRAPIAGRVKDHPGIARALSYLQKVMVLAPRRADAYSETFEVYDFTHDEPAMRALQERIVAAAPENPDQLANLLDYIHGTKDGENRVSLAAAIKRNADLINTLRPRGGATLAVALDNQMDAMIQLDACGGAADADQVVALAEESRRSAAASSTEQALINAYAFRAIKTLRGADGAFGAFFDKCGRSVPAICLLAALAEEPGPFQPAVLQNADVRLIVGLIREEAAKFPENRACYEWALLKNIDAAEADKAAASIQASTRGPLEESIGTLLAPADADGALEMYWRLKLAGKSEEAGKVLAKVEAMGVPLPIQP